jgi:hypothetical protein
MAERSKIQFRMQDLLWAVTLIGAAMGLFMTLPRIVETFPMIYVFRGRNDFLQ